MQKRFVCRLVGGLVFAASVVLVRADAPAVPSPEASAWLRYPAISPDGQSIAFTSGGQLWLVPAQGGEATPLTSGEFYSTRPVWSPDGTAIAFASKRNGNFDVFLIPVEGGTPQRLTRHSADDLPFAFSADGRTIYFASARLGRPESELVGDFAGSQQLYTVPTEGGAVTLVLPTPALDVAVSPDGTTLVYDNRLVYENEWRKGAVSDGTRDLWLYDLASGRHRQLTTHRGEDRDGFFAPDGKSVYYLSEQDGGSFNVWQRGLEPDAQPRPITDHEGRPVRFISVARDGTLVYAYDGGIWRIPAAGGAPGKVDIRIRQSPLVSGAFSALANRFASEIAVRPDGSEVAVVARGEIFVVSTADGRSRRITTTPAFEQHVSFSPDGRRLLYVSERDGVSHIYETALPEGRAGFASPGKLEEARLVDSSVDLLFPAYAPDGTRIAYLENRNGITVWDRDDATTRQALPPGSVYSYLDGDHQFAWSPDGRFILSTVGSIAGDMDIALCDASGENPPVNLSRSGYINMSPVFLPDGQAVLWTSDREGLRSPDGTGGQVDLFIAHLTEEAYAAFKLTLSGTEPARSTATNQIDTAWQPQTEGIRHRITRLTPYSLEQIVYLKPLPGGREVLLVGINGLGQMVGYRVGIATESFTPIFTRPMTVASASMDDAGTALFGVGPAGLERILLDDGRTTAIPFTAPMDYDPRGEMAWLFQHVWQMTYSKFYDPGMHGRDWDAIRDDYVRYLPGLQQWEDFCDVLGEMAGELNASHMGCYWLHPPDLADATAALGIYEDPRHDGPGVKVQQVLVGGPCDLSMHRLTPGSVITELDGEPVLHNEHLHALLNGKAGSPVELAVMDPGASGLKRFVVTPVSLAAEKALTADQWVERRRARTEELSGGRIGYLHLSFMNRENYQRAVDYVFGEGRDKDGLVIDIRYNGGGNLHDQLVTLFTGEVAADFRARDGFHASRIPADRWGKPSILLANAASYSDGSIFPHLYQRLKIGPVVGARVPGTGTAVWWMLLLNGNIKYGIPQLGAKDRTTGWFENHETVPELLVYNTPDDVAAGRDPQLDAAVARLMKDLPAGGNEKD